MGLYGRCNVNVEVMIATPKYIIRRVSTPNSNLSWIYSFINGEPNIALRTGKWEEWITIINRWSGSAVCIGDWNCLWDSSNKRGGWPLNRIDIEGGLKIPNAAHLSDL